MRIYIIIYVHWMTASVMEMAIIVSVFVCKLVDIVPLLFFITISKNDTAVVEYSCVKLMFSEFC